MTALPVWRRRKRLRPGQLAAAMTELAEVGGRSRGPLAGSGYLSTLRSRLEGPGRPDRAALGAVIDALATAAGRTPISFGSWHGDWTDWNMACTAEGLLVWDWERFTRPVPVGFDALHYRLQSAAVRRRQPPRAAAAECVRAAPSALTPFGVPATEARLVAILYLTELSARYLADRQAEAGAQLGQPGTWLIPAIKEAVEPSMTEASTAVRLARSRIDSHSVPPAAKRAARRLSATTGRLTHRARMLPGFLIVGAQRCGTTSMYRALSQHPAMLKAVLHKGVHYFDTGYDHGLAWYQGHFPLRAPAALVRRAVGEIPLTFEWSPYYMFHPLAAQRISRELPGIKLLVLVRDPVERAYSAHAHELARGYETEPFERALELEDRAAGRRGRADHQRGPGTSAAVVGTGLPGPRPLRRPAGTAGEAVRPGPAARGGRLGRFFSRSRTRL